MRTCKFEGCDRKHNSHGLCEAHYQQLRRGIPLKPIRRRVIGAGCDSPGCDKPHHANGFCDPHYQQSRRPEPYRFDPRFCSFPGCDKKHDSRGLCVGHSQQRAKGNPLTPLRPKNKVGRDPERRKLSAQIGSRRRYERKANAVGFCTQIQLEARLAYYGYHCAYCPGPFEHIDHVIPLSKGGTGWPANLVPACKSCNLSKAMKNVWEWLRDCVAK